MNTILFHVTSTQQKLRRQDRHTNLQTTATTQGCNTIMNTNFVWFFLANVLASGVPLVEGQQTIAYQSFEDEVAVASDFVDPLDGTTDHDVVNVAGSPIVDSTSSSASAGSLGFDLTLVATRASSGLNDDEIVGVQSDASDVGSFTDGTQGYRFSDGDARLVLTFDSVDVAEYQNVVVSVDYFIRDTTWEAAEDGPFFDEMSIVVVTDVSTDIIQDTDGADIDDIDPSIEGQWISGSVAIPDDAATATLIISVESDSRQKTMYFDNVLFIGDLPSVGCSCGKGIFWLFCKIWCFIISLF